MAMNQDERDEKIGRAIVTLGWWIFAAKFIIIATVLVGIAVYLLGKLLWIAPLIAIGAFVVYRLIWRLIWLLTSF